MGNGRNHKLSLHPRANEENNWLWVAVAEKVLESTTEGVLVMDRNTVVQWVNPAFTDITGYSTKEIVGKRPFFLRLTKEGQEYFWRRIRRYVAKHEVWEGKLWLRRKNGEILSRWVTITTVKDKEGEITHYVALCTSQAHKETSPQRVAHLTHYDSLTGLGNRLQFYDLFETAVNLTARRGLCLTLLYVDLDRFDDINAALGFLAGDRALQLLARRIRELLRHHGTALRIGGDEFVILLSLEKEEQAALWGEEILKCLRQPVRIMSQDFVLTGSVGVAFYPKDGAGPDELLHAAHLAAKRAKIEGKDRLAFFALEDHAALTERLTLERELREAVEHKRWHIFYQPYFSLKGKRVAGVEALLRWPHPQRGLLTPGHFIDLAEETGLIIPLGEYVLHSACAQLRKIQEKGLGSISLSVNVSGRQVSEAGFVETVKKILGDTGFDPRFLELEITETVAVKDPETLGKVFAELHKLGVRLAIDDFGTGYGTFHYLRYFPVHTIKIDRSFVKGLPGNRHDNSIVLSILTLARNMDCRALAEGVETREQLEWLAERGCDLVQGYLMSPPVPLEELWAKLRHSNSN